MFLHTCVSWLNTASMTDVVVSLTSQSVPCNPAFPVETEHFAAHFHPTFRCTIFVMSQATKTFSLFLWIWLVLQQQHWLGTFWFIFSLLLCGLEVFFTFPVCGTSIREMMPSVLWRCWLGSKKDIRPVKNWGVGYWCGYTPCPEKNGTNNVLGITLTKFNKFSQFLAQLMLTYQLTKKL